MGNAQSGVITLEDFKDKLFGTTVFLLSGVVNPQLEYKSSETCSSDNLPLPKVDSDNIYNLAWSYYNESEHNNTEKDLNEMIENYVYKNILNSEENLKRFHKSLVDMLLANSKFKQDKKSTQLNEVVEVSKKQNKSVTKPKHNQQPVNNHTNDYCGTVPEFGGECVLTNRSEMKKSKSTMKNNKSGNKSDNKSGNKSRENTVPKYKVIVEETFQEDLDKMGEDLGENGDLGGEGEIEDIDGDELEYSEY